MCVCGGGGGGHFLHSAVLLLHVRGMVLRSSNYKCAYILVYVVSFSICALNVHVVVLY